MRNALVIITAVLAMVYFDHPAAVAQQAPAVQRWEYGRLVIIGVHLKFVSASGVLDSTKLVGRAKDGEDAYFTNAMNALGSQGWEYIGDGAPYIWDRVDDQSPDRAMFFKRPLHG